MLGDVRAVRVGREPMGAGSLRSSSDHMAATQRALPLQHVPVSLKGSVPSDDIPIYLSGFSEASGIQVTEADLVSDTENDVQPPAETTLLSPGNKRKGT